MATGEETMESTSEIPKELSFDELSRITNNFSDDRKMGESKIGTLYKGIMDDNKVIAVKKLDDNAEIPTLKFEVQKIMAAKHENLVRLVGFCSEAQEKLVPSDDIGVYNIADITANLLCYEYFPGGNLADYLFGTKAALDISSAEPGTSKVAKDISSAVPNFDWDSRFRIINGICQGLLFLHSLDRPIIHMDLRLENIWLGANMVPKIGNFGLSRLFESDTTKTTKTVVGSYGYMAPEYLYKGEISTKADIYSLGLLIIEISTGEKNCSDEKQPSGRKYIKEIRAGWTADHIASKYSWLDAEHLHQIDACIKTGLQCVEVDRRNRPTIQEIVDSLNAS